MKTSKALTVFRSILILFVLTRGQLLAEPKVEEWLRGSGKDLQICLKGEVMDADGKPALDASVKILLDSDKAEIPVNVEMDENRFKAWIPLNQLGWFIARVTASSSSSKDVAYENVIIPALRQSAIDGIKLTLKPATRRIEFKVLDNGKAVRNASVEINLEHISKLRARTDAEGVARFDVLPDQKLTNVRAWTDDRRVGGYGFDRKPVRDADANEHIVELTKCRDLKMTFVDEKGTTIPNIKFVIQVATGQPNINYIPANEDSHMESDAKGEAVFRFLPDWDNVHFYADINSPGWIPDGELKRDRDSVTYKLKKAKERIQATGRITTNLTSPGGFSVHVTSRDGEREGHIDLITTFTNADGTFSIDVLPDATYCVNVDDSRWIGNMIDVLPYRSNDQKHTPINVSVFEGQDVEIIATMGPSREPYPDLPIYFRRNHRYEYHYDGKKHNGIASHDRWLKSDVNGKVTVRTLPGEIEVTAYAPRWNTKKTINVEEGKPTKILLHREVDKKMKVTGRLILDENLKASWENTVIEAGSVDGIYDDEKNVKCNADGTFSFEMLASEVGIFARTADGLAAGSTKTADLDKPVKLKLKPTGNFEGQLLGDNNEPLAGKTVQAAFRVNGSYNRNARRATSFGPEPIKAVTDDQGNFTLKGLPIGMETRLAALGVLGSGRDRDRSLGDIYLEPNDSRPRTIFRPAKNAKKREHLTIEQEYAQTLRDCKLAGYMLLVLIADDEKQTTDFISDHFSNSHNNKDLYSFESVTISAGKNPLDPTQVDFLKKHQWPSPTKGSVLAYVIDGNEKVLDNLTVNPKDEESPKKIVEFIHKHTPKAEDAEKKWAEAFAEAKRTNRRVWARVGNHYCGPCRDFTRWIGEQKKLLEKDFVLLKIDNLHDTDGDAVSDRIFVAKERSIPFHTIFDQDQKVLISGVNAMGNIGNAGGLESLRHLRKMITTTRQNLSDAEIDQIVESKSSE